MNCVRHKKKRSCRTLSAAEVMSVAVTETDGFPSLAFPVRSISFILLLQVNIHFSFLRKATLFSSKMGQDFSHPLLVNGSFPPGATVNIRNMQSGRFFTCEPSYHVVANRDNAAEWERFTIEPGVRPNSFAFRTFHGTYLSSEPSGLVIGNRQQIGEWESFNLEHAGGNQVYLRTAHGTLISSQGNLEVASYDGNMTQNELWDLVPHAGFQQGGYQQGQGYPQQGYPQQGYPQQGGYEQYPPGHHHHHHREEW